MSLSRPPFAGILDTSTRVGLLESLRRYLQTAYGLTTWHLRPPSSSYVFESDLVEEASGEAACYDAAQQTVHLGPAATHASDAFRRGNWTPWAVSGLRTALHELWHATSPMLQYAPDDYEHHAVGRLVEEGVAEYRARQVVVRDLLGGGDYRPLMDDPSWESFFGSRSLEANGIYAFADACGERALATVWTRHSARDRAKALNAALAPVITAHLLTLGAGRPVVEAAGSGVAGRGYRLLLDKAASQPFAARRPDDLPLAAVRRAADLPAALAALRATGILPVDVPSSRDPR